MCWVAASAPDAEKKKNPAPSTGNKLHLLRDPELANPVACRLMSVYTPSAFHHGRQQFRFLLVSARQIFTRQSVLRFFRDPVFAVCNKIVNSLEVLAQGRIDVGGAREVHAGQIGFLLVQSHSNFTQGVMFL